MSGRKLPKRHTYVERKYPTTRKDKFPNCIGTFEDCKSYTPEMPIEQRLECKLCPNRE